MCARHQGGLSRALGTVSAIRQMLPDLASRSLPCLKDWANVSRELRYPLREGARSDLGICVRCPYQLRSLQHSHSSSPGRQGLRGVHEGSVRLGRPERSTRRSPYRLRVSDDSRSSAIVWKASSAACRSLTISAASISGSGRFSLSLRQSRSRFSLSRLASSLYSNARQRPPSSSGLHVEGRVGEHHRETVAGVAAKAVHSRLSGGPVPCRSRASRAS